MEQNMARVWKPDIEVTINSWKGSSYSRMKQVVQEALAFSERNGGRRLVKAIVKVDFGDSCEEILHYLQIEVQKKRAKVWEMKTEFTFPITDED